MVLGRHGIVRALLQMQCRCQVSSGFDRKCFLLNNIYVPRYIVCVRVLGQRLQAEKVTEGSIRETERL